MTTTSSPTIWPAGPSWPVGYRIRYALDRSGMDVQQLADKLGVSRTTVSNYMHGRSRPRTMALIAIAHATGAPLAWLEHGISDEEEGDADTAAVTHRDTFAFAA